MSNIIEAATIPYGRELAERALYPWSALNYMTGGMAIGQVSIIAGETGSGKTTMISQTQNGIMKDNDRVLVFYGESTLEEQFAIQLKQLTPYNRDTWEYKPFYKNGKKTNVGDYFITEADEQKARDFLKKRLYYYDCAKGMKIEQISNAIQYCQDKGNVRYVFIDNLMQIDFSGNDEIKEQKDATEQMRRMAIDKKIHICLVAHYRKNNERATIRRTIQEICGTSQIGNKAACAINIIRLDNVDKSTREYKNLSSVLEANSYDISGADAILEVLKTRFNRLGFVLLKYWNTTKTYSEITKDGTTETREETPFDPPKVYAEQKEFKPEDIF